MGEALKKNASNSHPNAICIGSIGAITSSVIVCNRKVITEKIWHMVFSVILALICTHYAFNLSYNPVSQQVMEFLQEKLLGDRLASSRKTTTAYSRAIHRKDEAETIDDDCTQPFLTFGHGHVHAVQSLLLFVNSYWFCFFFAVFYSLWLNISCHILFQVVMVLK